MMIEQIKQLEKVLDAKVFDEQDGSKTYLVYTAWECKNINVERNENTLEVVKKRLKNV